MATLPFTLGRHIQHDPRSKRFMAHIIETPRTVLWDHKGPVLDQLKIGSCTGTAMAQCLNTDAFTNARKNGLYLTQAEGIALYSAATILDDIPGAYLPEDTGSTGLAVCKAAVQQGYIRSYRHAFGFDQMLGALQYSPVLAGTNWYADFYTPNPKGFVTIGSSRNLGGHEFLVLGANMEEEYITCLNSWSDRWGVKGRFHVPFNDFRRLLEEDGDIVVPAL